MWHFISQFWEKSGLQDINLQFWLFFLAMVRLFSTILQKKKIVRIVRIKIQNYLQFLKKNILASDLWFANLCIQLYFTLLFGFDIVTELKVPAGGRLSTNAIICRTFFIGILLKHCDLSNALSCLPFVFFLPLIYCHWLLSELYQFLIFHVRWTNIAALWDAKLSDIIILFISVQDTDGRADL